jgi:hypothetical protein
MNRQSEQVSTQLLNLNSAAMLPAAEAPTLDAPPRRNRWSGCCRRWRAIAPFFLAAAVGCLWALPAHGIEISDPQWGFDGKVRLNRFNLLTMTVDNPSSTPVELELSLRKVNGASYMDAPLVEQIYLGPGARRSVQFYPYISNEWGGWKLTWGRGESIDLAQPRSGRRGSRVLLESTDVLGNTKGSMRRFPENAFPPFVTATDALQAVVLDHVPRWDEPRRQAFLDWIYRGGAVFVLQGPSGKHPEFPASMNQLNGPLETVRFGSGVVHRLAMNRNQLSREEVRKLWDRLPNVVSLKPAIEPGMPQPASKSGDDDDDEANLPFSYSEGGAYGAHSFLDELKQMSKPEHNWLLLHFMFWIYILLIFPGCFLLGKQRNDFRMVYLALLGIVVVFSLAFATVGQRGAGESTTIHSVAIIQALPDGYLDVAEWSNAFVRSGAIYDIRHNGSGALYSTCQDTEEVQRLIRNGGDAVFQADIPPFSSREFAHRIKVKGTLPLVQVEKIAADETGLNELKLKVDDSLPKVEGMYVAYRDRFYSVGRFEDRISLRSNVGSVPAFLRIEQNSGMYSPFARMGDERTADLRFRDLFFPLITRALNVQSLPDAQAFRLSSDQLRLIYYADLPTELNVQNPRFPKQIGKALFCIDVPITEAPVP